MAIHPDVAARFHYLDGLPSLREAYGDPVLIHQIRQFETWEAAGPPAVHTRGESAPGPHGPVPVRIYTPSAEGTGRRPVPGLAARRRVHRRRSGYARRRLDRERGLRDRGSRRRQRRLPARRRRRVLSGAARRRRRRRHLGTRPGRRSRGRSRRGSRSAARAPAGTSRQAPRSSCGTGTGGARPRSRSSTRHCMRGSRHRHRRSPPRWPNSRRCSTGMPRREARCPRTTSADRSAPPTATRSPPTPSSTGSARPSC